jgi:hypothetical protein
MPFLPEALASVEAQTYRNFELIVQDSCSNDGTLEVLRDAKNIPNLKIVSEPDNGVGDAYNRALRRTCGEVVGSIDSDNLLVPNALQSAVEIYAQNPHCAAIYGAANVIDLKGDLLHCHHPAAFDPLRIMCCELVPPFGSAFFSKQVCGTELRYDEMLETCADFDLWLRLSRFPILHTDTVFNSTRLSSKSMSCNPERYEIFCRDKITALEKYLCGLEEDGLRQSIRRRSVAGIYCWAAESIYGIEGESVRFADFCQRAAAVDPDSSQLHKFRVKADYELVRCAYEQVHAEYERVHAEYERVQSDRNTLFERVHEMQSELEQLRRRLQLMENSKGWKVLERYRKVRGTIKKLLRPASR